MTSGSNGTASSTTWGQRTLESGETQPFVQHLSFERRTYCSSLRIRREDHTLTGIGPRAS